MDVELTETLLKKQDAVAASILLADAFHNNPAHTYIFPNDQKRREQMKWLMRTNLNAQLKLGQSFAKKSADGSIAAMGFWHPPDAPQANTFQLFRFGFFSMPFLHGMSAFKRMLHAVQEIELRRARALNGRKSWYLNNMVISPDLRGQGLGGETLRHQLETWVSPSGHLASLTTQKIENVNFYRALGFEVVDDTPITDDQREFQNWVMIFEAKPSPS